MLGTSPTCHDNPSKDGRPRVVRPGAGAGNFGICGRVQHAVVWLLRDATHPVRLPRFGSGGVVLAVLRLLPDVLERLAGLLSAVSAAAADPAIPANPANRFGIVAEAGASAAADGQCSGAEAGGDEPGFAFDVPGRDDREHSEPVY
jgi:hypothetical protein